MDRIVPAVSLTKPEPSFQSSASKEFVLLKAEALLAKGREQSHTSIQWNHDPSIPSVLNFLLVHLHPATAPLCPLHPMMDGEAAAAECIDGHKG